MSHVNEGPIANYNSLHDSHLISYFGNQRIRKHLVKAGLITKEGRLVSEEQYRILLARREHKKMIKGMLSQAIVQRTMEVERQRQAEIKKKLEEIAKFELVKRVRASRGRRGDEEVLQFLLPLPSGEKGGKQKRSKRSSSGNEEEEAEDSSRIFDSFAHLRRRGNQSPYQNFGNSKLEMMHWTNLDRKAIEEYNELTHNVDTLPALAPYNNAEFHKGRRVASPKRQAAVRSASMSRIMSLHRPASSLVLHETKQKSLNEITMKFLGSGGLGTGPYDVSIDQQHCGGNTLIVFRKHLYEGDSFTFVSRRHLEYPFSLTFYIDGKVDCRLSTCCEYKHRCGHRLGGSQGHFKLLEVRGGSPCSKGHHPEGTSKKKGKQDTDETMVQQQQKRQRPLLVKKGVSSATGSERKKTASSNSESKVYHQNKSAAHGYEYGSVKHQSAIYRLSDVDKPGKKKTTFSDSRKTHSEDSESSESSDSSSVPDDQESTPREETSSNPNSGRQSQLSQERSGLFATLTAAQDDNNSSKTAIVKLPQILGGTEPEPSLTQSKQYDTTITTSEMPKTIVTAEVEPVNSQYEQDEDDSPVILPVQPLKAVLVDENMLSHENSSATNSRMSKKSVSFNDVRDERQISDDEQLERAPSTELTESPLPAAGDEERKDQEEEEEDPDAVAKHEAALALEDQARASEDKTPFLQPGSTVLDINKRILSDRQVRRLCAEILNSERLEKIVIRESGLNDGMVQRICDALHHSPNNIRLLCFNLNAISAAGVVHVVQLLHAKPSIKMLLLYGNPLGDNGINALVDGIFGDLPEDLVNQLSAQGIEMPSQNEDDPVSIKLTHLDLGEIGMSSAGAIKFSKLLNRLPTLRVLNLGGNHTVGLEGWNAISKTLSDKSYPSKLCLSHCRLGNKCTSELATSLRTNRGVAHIDLEGCGIGEEGGRALMDLVDSEPRMLEDIILDDNRIPDLIVHRISNGLRRLRGENEEEEEGDG